MGSAETTPARILVVEDDPDLHDLILKIVRRSGHEALSAHTGEQALSILRDSGEHVDWLITDIRLPGIVDGWVVGREFTMRHPLRPVIYMSGIAHDAFLQRGPNSIFLQKPVNVSTLAGTLKVLSGNMLTPTARL